MTILTIQENIKLSQTDFTTYEELVNFIISSHSGIEFEELTQDEKEYINNLDEFKKFKKLANSI